MEYERIDKVQMGILSPSKLRINLFGSPQRIKGEGKRSCSSSPIKCKDAVCALLAEDREIRDEVDVKWSEGVLGTAVDLDVEGINSGNKPSIVVDGSLSDSRCSDPSIHQPPSRESTSVHAKMQSFPQPVVPSLKENMVHPIKSTEENVDYESEHENAASSGFEFHRPDKSLQRPVTMVFCRPLPSKWNDAEKWIVSKQPVRTNHSRRIGACIQTNPPSCNHATRIIPEALATDQRQPVHQVVNIKRNSAFLPEIEHGSEKLRFAGPVPDQIPGPNVSVNIEKPITYPTAISNWSGPLDSSNLAQHPFSAVKSVSMRDMGTEMTPTASQEPSRTGTPAIATTPVLSPDPSVPSTPRKDVIAPPFSSESSNNKKEHQVSSGKVVLSERELRLKTRREIQELGMQLGKINIAAWASQEEDDKEVLATTKTASPAHLEKVEFESRAAEWVEVKKAKHDARYEREVVKIQTWENHIKAKAEAEMRRIQVKVEHMTASTRERLLHRLTAARLQAEAKRKASVAKRDQWEVKVAQQSEHIRRTGYIPWSCFSCYSVNCDVRDSG